MSPVSLSLYESSIPGCEISVQASFLALKIFEYAHTGEEYFGDRIRNMNENNECCKDKFVNSKDFLISLCYDLNIVYYKNNSNYNDFISIKKIETVDGLFEKEECLRLSNINMNLVDSDGKLLTKVHTNTLESEIINVPSTETNSTLEADIIKKLSSEINSSKLSLQEGKDSTATELIPTKENCPSSALSLPKIHNPVEESIDK